MCDFQNSMGLPAMMCSMWRRVAYADMASPYGPAPMTSRGTRSASGGVASLGLDGDRNRLAASQAERGDPSPPPAIVEGMDEGGEQTCAGRSQGVTKRNRPAVKVDLSPVPSDVRQRRAVRERLRGKRFVQLDQVHILERPPNLAEQIGNRLGRRVKDVPGRHGRL